MRSTLTTFLKMDGIKAVLGLDLVGSWNDLLSGSMLSTVNEERPRNGKCGKWRDKGQREEGKRQRGKQVVSVIWRQLMSCKF